MARWPAASSSSLVARVARVMVERLRRGRGLAVVVAVSLGVSAGDLGLVAGMVLALLPI